MPAFQRCARPRAGCRRPASWRAQFHGCALERGDERLQLVEQLAAAGHREGADDTDAGQVARCRCTGRAGASRWRSGPDLCRPVAGHHAVGRPLVLDLEHDPLVRLVRARQRLGDDRRQARRPRTREPPLRQGAVGRRRRQVDGAATPASAAPSAARRCSKGCPVRSSSPRASRSKAMKWAGVCAASSVTRRVRRVDPLQQRLEIEPGRPRRRSRSPRRSTHRGGNWPGPPRPARGSTGHRALVAAADLHLVAVGGR